MVYAQTNARLSQAIERRDGASSGSIGTGAKEVKMGMHMSRTDCDVQSEPSHPKDEKLALEGKARVPNR